MLANSPKIIPEALPGQVRDFDPELAQGMESVLKMGRTELRGILAMEDYPSDMTAGERPEL